MLIADLFPTCQAPSCEYRGRHKHILPSQQELIESQEQFIAAMGGYRSGKTYAACSLCTLLMLSIDGNRGFVGRRSYDLLHDSTLRVFLEVLERAEIEGTQYLENWRGFPHRIILPNFSEVVFRETKNLGRYLGPEYGFFYLDEALEEPEATFKGLVGRLCLPRAGHRLKGIITSNPPYQTHWIAKLFGQDPGVRQASNGIGYRLIKTSTRENVHLPDAYLPNLQATLSRAELHRVVEGNFGFIVEGPPVYPSFSYERHVVKGLAVRNASMIRGWDWGFRHHTAVWLQYEWCTAKKLHVYLHRELDACQATSEAFATQVLECSARWFPTIPKHCYIDAADAAGMQATNQGPGPIQRLREKPWQLRFRYTHRVDIDPVLDFIREIITPPNCPCGKPLFQVNADGCQNMIDTLAGGYHYPGRGAGEKPVKDGHYDDFADAFRYAIDNVVRLEYLKSQIRPFETPLPTAPAPDWAWMTGGW